MLKTIIHYFGALALCLASSEGATIFASLSAGTFTDGGSTVTSGTVVFVANNGDAFDYSPAVGSFLGGAVNDYALATVSINGSGAASYVNATQTTTAGVGSTSAWKEGDTVRVLWFPDTPFGQQPAANDRWGEITRDSDITWQVPNAGFMITNAASGDASNDLNISNGSGDFAVVPEPSSFVLFVMAFSCLFVRRKR